MNGRALDTDDRPRSEVLTVEALVHRVLEGEIRIPSFRASRAWGSTRTVELFDSLYRNFPIGTLLVQERPALAQRQQIGGVSIFAPACPNAWWVTDGQRRMTAIVACSARQAEPDTSPIVYFDARTRKFGSTGDGQEVLSTRVPVACLFDADRLAAWVDDELREVVVDAARRICEYEVRLSVVTTADLSVAEEIFRRTNRVDQIGWTEVREAFAATSNEAVLEGGLTGVFDEMRMGQLDRRELERFIADVGATDSSTESTTLPVALRSALVFLANANIPHIGLLPAVTVLTVVTRLFVLHPHPPERALILLRRWVWRLILGDDAFEPTSRERGTELVTSDLYGSLTALLSTTGRSPPKSYDIPDHGDTRSWHTRRALLAIATCGPRDCKSGDAVDVLAFIDDAEFGRYPVSSRSAASLFFARQSELSREALLKAPDRIQSSHAIDRAARDALADQGDEAFLAARSRRIENALFDLGRFAEWGRTDRPAIAHLVGRDSG